MGDGFGAGAAVRATPTTTCRPGRTCTADSSAAVLNDAQHPADAASRLYTSRRRRFVPRFPV